jgi:thymidylate synthase (FAD)
MDPHGFVKLVDTMPRENLDAAIVEAARVSYSKTSTKTVRSDEGLIRYLMRNWHNTPFEMVEFKFHIKMPIFLARQHMRHRMASVNEISGRYSVLPREYFVPDTLRKQSTINKQSSDEDTVIEKVFFDDNVNACESAFELYDTMIEEGVARELARCHLPLSTYTEFIWKIDLHNLMHYLQLRMEPGAQKEIRDYAIEIFELVKQHVPLTMKAFMDYRVHAVTLSQVDIECFKNNTQPENPGERREYIEKMKKLGIQ